MFYIKDIGNILCVIRVIIYQAKKCSMLSIHSQLHTAPEISIQPFVQFPLVVDIVLAYFSKIAWHL